MEKILNQSTIKEEKSKLQNKENQEKPKLQIKENQEKLEKQENNQKRKQKQKQKQKSKKKGKNGKKQKQGKNQEKFERTKVNSIWKNTWQIPNSNLTLAGDSRANLKSGFYIKKLNLMLDANISCYYKAKNILITNSKSDRSYLLPMILIDCKDADIYVPKSTVKMFENYNNATYALNAQKEDYIYENAFFKPALIGKTFDLKGVKNTSITVFECYHEVDSVGYGINVKKQKLKEEYRGKKGKELAALKKQGIEITNTEINHPFLYLGDTNCKILENPDILKYKVIMIECTFLYEDEDNQNSKNHICWSQLRPFVKAHPDNFFVVYHFSLKYQSNEIKEFFKKEKEKFEIENLKPWQTSENIYF